MSENKFKEIIDVVISFIVAVCFMILGSLLKFNNNIIEFFLSNVMPAFIIALTLIKNKPSVYLKYFTLKKRSRNIQLSFILKYSDFHIDNTNEYKDIVNSFIDKYSGNVRILKQNVGSEVCISSFIINSVNYEINYDDVGETLSLLIASQLSYKSFFDKVDKATNTMTDIASASNRNFIRAFTKVTLEFLGNNNEITNPFFRTIFNGFNVKSADIKFKTKNNTTVQLNNNCIIFTSVENSNELISEIKKIISI